MSRRGKKQQVTEYVSADAAADAARRAAKAAADRTAPLFDAASGRVVPAVEAALDKAGPKLAAAREKADPVIAKASPFLGQARGRAEDVAHDLAPHVEAARDRLVDDLVPRIEHAVNQALTSSEPYRAEAARRGGAALAALKGEVEPVKKKRKIGPGLLVVAGIAGLAALAYKYLTGESKSSGWQTPSGSTYTPPPATKPEPTPESETATAPRAQTAPPAGSAPADGDESADDSTRETPTSS